MDTPGLLPLLPRREVLLEGLPARAVVLEELAPALGDGAITVSHSSGTGLLLARRAALLPAVFYIADQRQGGELAAARLREITPDGRVTALRIDGELVDVLAPLLLDGEACYRQLHLAWTDWDQLLADLESRSGSHLVELSCPAGRGATLIQDGRQVATYADFHPEPGDPALLDGLTRQPAGTIDVLRSRDGTGSAGEPLPAAVAAGGLEAAGGQPEPPLLAALRVVARDRLHRSAPRVERLLDQASAGARPLDLVIAEIRTLSIRGVLPATMEEIADEMAGLAGAQR